MIKISKLADYSVVILVALAEGDKPLMSTSMLSEVTKLSEPTVSKILKLLSKAGIVNSTRGINGGYSLAFLPENILVEAIVRSIDGPISIAACADDNEPDCSLSDSCSVRGRWDEVNTAIRTALEQVSLADMLGKDHVPCCSAQNIERG